MIQPSFPEIVDRLINTVDQKTKIKYDKIKSKGNLENRKIKNGKEFKILVQQVILNRFGGDLEFLAKIKELGKVQLVRFSDKIVIPGIQSKVIEIYDANIQNVLEIIQFILENHEKILKNIKQLDLFFFVKQQLVSSVIGSKGSSIKSLCKQSNTKIIVMPQITNLKYRAVKITGTSNKIPNACKLIHHLLEQKASIGKIIKQKQVLELCLEIILKFDKKVIKFLKKNKQQIIKKLEKETVCSIQYSKSSDKQEKRNIEIKGKIDGIYGTISIIFDNLVVLLTIIQNYYQDYQDFQQYTVKLLIPTNYVTKLIGWNGSRVKMFSQKSGAQITFPDQSNNQSRFSPVIVSGTRQNKIDAICYILQHIECQIRGGPVFESGKVLKMDFKEYSLANVKVKLQQSDLQQQTLKNNMELKHSNYEEHKKDAKYNTIKTDGLKNTKDQSDEQIQAGQIKNEHIFKEYSKPSSESNSKSNSRSRSRTKKYHNFSKKHSPPSTSRIPNRLQTNILELKVIIPRSLANDQAQLKYIEQISNVSIKLTSQVRFQVKQKIGTSENILLIKGNIRENNQCMKLLMKRLAKFQKKL